MHTSSWLFLYLYLYFTSHSSSPSDLDNRTTEKLMNLLKGQSTFRRIFWGFSLRNHLNPFAEYIRLDVSRTNEVRSHYVFWDEVGGFVAFWQCETAATSIDIYLFCLYILDLILNSFLINNYHLIKHKRTDTLTSNISSSLPPSNGIVIRYEFTLIPRALSFMYPDPIPSQLRWRSRLLISK